MIDTLKATLKHDTEAVRCINRYCIPVSERYEEHTGQVSYYYNIGGFKVSTYGGGVVCLGGRDGSSLSAYQNGVGSVRPFDLTDTQAAIESLEAELHTSIKSAKVQRIDIGVNVPFNYPPSYLFDSLIGLKNLTRIERKHSVTFGEGGRGVIVYDKLDKLKRAKVAPVLPKEWGDDTNVIRLESRFKTLQAVASLLHKGATLADVTTKEAFLKMRCNLLETWRLMDKQDMKEIQEINGVKDLLKFGFAEWLEQTGIERATKIALANVKDRQKRYRLKAQIKELADVRKAVNTQPLKDATREIELETFLQTLTQSDMSELNDTGKLHNESEQKELERLKQCITEM